MSKLIGLLLSVGYCYQINLAQTDPIQQRLLKYVFLIYYLNESHETGLSWTVSCLFVLVGVQAFFCLARVLID